MAILGLVTLQYRLVDVGLVLGGKVALYVIIVFPLILGIMGLSEHEAGLEPSIFPFLLLFSLLDLLWAELGLSESLLFLFLEISGGLLPNLFNFHGKGGTQGTN